ncbi:MAG: hypothetical protein AAFQ52_07095 [Chloroflexota bacterium]
MHQRVRVYQFGFVVGTVVLCIMLLGAVIPSAAQGGAFATNTPVGNTGDDADATVAPMIFATNTPAGGIASTPVPTMIPTQAGPESVLFNYALRFWLEEDLVNVLFDQVNALTAEEEDAQLAVNILLYELERRFPGAPTDPEQRAQLIEAVINAPVGTLDMRTIVEPFVQNAINMNPDAGTIEANGFQITLTPVNLDGANGTDRLVQIRYVDDEDVVRYDEYRLATATENNTFALLPTTYDIPAVPFDGVNAVSVYTADDVTANSLDEVVLRVDDNGVSDRFYILSYRNGRAVDLVDPDLELRVGEIVSWNLPIIEGGAPDLTVLETRAESSYPDWQCNSQIEYTWRFERNLYRRSADLNARFNNVPSLGCRLVHVDLFALSTSEAITEVESALLEFGFDSPSATRALMTLAMLYVQAGRIDEARNTAQSIITVGDDETWESQQANALITASGVASNTALDICAALALASESPACDMDATLGRFLTAVDIQTDSDLITQLETFGLPVVENELVSAVGRADRTAVLFALPDTGWWGFVDARDGTYNAEPIDAPAGFEETAFPLVQTQVPQTAYDALLVEDNPARVLTILENVQRENDAPNRTSVGFPYVIVKRPSIIPRPC